jgi:hypothetical protein
MSSLILQELAQCGFEFDGRTACSCFWFSRLLKILTIEPLCGLVFTCSPLAYLFQIYCIQFVIVCRAAENLSSPQPPDRESPLPRMHSPTSPSGFFTPMLASLVPSGGLRVNPAITISPTGRRSDIAAISPFGLPHPEADLRAHATMSPLPSPFDKPPPGPVDRSFGLASRHVSVFDVSLITYVFYPAVVQYDCVHDDAL